jgi:hypothetical protein
MTEQRRRVAEQPPSQRTKRDPRAALAASFTAVPAGRLVVHRRPQSIPPPRTVPVPRPVLCTVSLTFGFGAGVVVVVAVVAVGGAAVTSTAIGCVRTRPPELPLTVIAYRPGTKPEAAERVADVPLVLDIGVSATPIPGGADAVKSTGS